MTATGAAVFDWDFAWQIRGELLDGLGVTMLSVALGMSLAIVVGLSWTLLRRSGHRWVRWPAHGVVEFIRSTPLLVQLYFLYFGLPLVLPDLQFSAFATGVVALGIHYSTYCSEVYRAGIENVPRGQWEAALALNLPRRVLWTRVILPQAIPPVIPALGNYLIAMLKDAPLLYAISVAEILGKAVSLGGKHYSYLEPYTLVGAMFLAMSLLMAGFVRLLERILKVRAV